VNNHITLLTVAPQDGVEMSARDKALIAALNEAITLMPLGTKKRAEWLVRAAKLVRDEVKSPCTGI